ncbi:hypothetical protein TRFO_18963 [Tritrichomonas foetus]|uniref:Ubiquitin-like domain-containing protein n=1 Tax=Tritrichomonas foetus TaxID=1144522 RepID=A0A1J4KJM6_9EUKA|nr:hypothetical protein TRFO_18963 [Tritrichomonas foetus]|eukprot:OHT11519.1 hypothetical protein TRFO_18963 [Tritrichomonas foetus]
MQKEITLSLLNISGKKITVKVPNTNSVRSFIEIIGNGDIKNSSYIFLHNGKKLDIDISLMAQGIKDNDSIVFLRNKAKNMKKMIFVTSETAVDELKSFDCFLSDIYNSFLRSNDLIFDTIDSEKDANCIYAQYLLQNAELMECRRSERPHRKFPTILRKSKGISTQPLPQPWNKPPKVTPHMMTHTSPRNGTLRFPEDFMW